MLSIVISIDTAADPGDAVVTCSEDIGELLRRYLADDPHLTTAQRTAAGMVASALDSGGTLEAHLLS